VINYLAGISTVVGGQFVAWNVGLQAGFYEFVMATAMIGIAYCCLTYCIAEMTSVLPFSGSA